MIIIPKEEPFLENLNTYYVDISKLIEHCQGELGTGAIYLSGNMIQAIIFFDKDAIINGILRIKDEETFGKEVIKNIIDLAGNTNLNLTIYHIDPGRLYFFSHLSDSEILYKDLSSEFTDLEGLMRKMAAERLTGFIEVSIGRGEEEAYLLFDRGIMIGGSFSWAGNNLNRSTENLNELLLKCREKGAYFNVARLKIMETKVVKADTKVIPEADLIAKTEELLNMSQKLFNKELGKKLDFSVLLKRKFVEKSETYPYLDPFAGEFVYKDNKVSYEGDARPQVVFNAIYDCLKEIYEETGLSRIFHVEITPNFVQYVKK